MPHVPESRSIADRDVLSCSASEVSDVLAVATHTITAGRDANGVVQVTGRHNQVVVNVVNVLAADAGRERLPAIPPGRISSLLGANPYRSLDAFDEESSELFFGRDQFTATLLRRLEKLAIADPATSTFPRLLAILGPSGCGKSSVARAGLVPAIATSGVRRLQRAEVVILQPGRRPVEALATVLARAVTRDPAPVAKTREFETQIYACANAGTHDGLVRIARSRGNSNSALIILVDQFEETYTLVPSGDEKHVERETKEVERDIFVRTLLHAAFEPGESVFVVLTLRTDFYGEVTVHREMSAAISGSHELVPAMSGADLAVAISEPAKRRGLNLPETIVDSLVRQATDNPSALPLVQHALFRLWNALAEAGDDAAEERMAYSIVSNLGGAIAATAEETMAALASKSARDIAWTAFLRGVQLGEGAKDTRRRVAFAEIVPSDKSVEEVREALRPFVRERLLTLGGVADDLSTPWLEITHEILITNWPGLRTRISDGRSAERLARRAQEAADRWRRNEGGLWQGRDLDQLVGHASIFNLTTSQQRFLHASRVASIRRKVVNYVAVLALIFAALGGVTASVMITRQNGQLISALNDAKSARQTAEEALSGVNAQIAASAAINMFGGRWDPYALRDPAAHDTPDAPELKGPEIIVGNQATTVQRLLDKPPKDLVLSPDPIVLRLMRDLVVNTRARRPISKYVKASLTSMAAVKSAYSLQMREDSAKRYRQYEHDYRQGIVDGFGGLENPTKMSSGDENWLYEWKEVNGKTFLFVQQTFGSSTCGNGGCSARTILFLKEKKATSVVLLTSFNRIVLLPTSFGGMPDIIINAGGHGGAGIEDSAVQSFRWGSGGGGSYNPFFSGEFHFGSATIRYNGAFDVEDDPELQKDDKQSND